MTETSTINGSATATALIPELVDLLSEPIVRPHDSLKRAAVIVNLLGQLCAAVEGLHGPGLTLDDTAREVASLRQLVAAGQDHQRRMTTRAVAAAVGGRR